MANKFKLKRELKKFQRELFGPSKQNFKNPWWPVRQKYVSQVRRWITVTAFEVIWFWLNVVVFTLMPDLQFVDLYFYSKGCNSLCYMSFFLPVGFLFIFIIGMFWAMGWIDKWAKMING